MKKPIDDVYNNPVANLEEIELAQQLYPLFKEMEFNKEHGIVAEPDTAGLDFFFLLSFKTEDMRDEFFLIEQEFMMHCGNRLDALNAVAWYDEAYYGITKPTEVLFSYILRLIYNGAKIGDTYCVELIKRLYKTYHKKEYNTIKKFSSLSQKALLSIVENNTNEHEDLIIARIVGMSRFLGIGLKNECVIIYKFFEQRKELFFQGVDKAIKGVEIKDETYLEAEELVNKWLGDADSNPSLVRDYKEFFDFSGHVFKYEGFEACFLNRCLSDFQGGRYHLTMTLALLKTIHPEKKYSFNEVQIYSHVRDLALALTNVSREMAVEVGLLLGEDFDKEHIGELKFKGIAEKPTEPGKTSPHDELVNTASISSGDVDTETFIKEIEDLRAKNNRLKQENSALKNENRTYKHEAAGLRAISERFEAERTELIKLRDYAYRSTSEEVELNEENESFYENMIRDKKILIIGGHPNWHRKVKERFPKWTCIDSEKFSSLNPSMTDGYDKVYFYTKHIGHPEYGKFVSYMNKNNIWYGYIGTVNINSLIVSVGADVQEA